jgi:hypothetical protein
MYTERSELARALAESRLATLTSGESDSDGPRVGRAANGRYDETSLPIIETTPLEQLGLLYAMNKRGQITVVATNQNGVRALLLTPR